MFCDMVTLRGRITRDTLTTPGVASGCRAIADGAIERGSQDFAAPLE
jgi:hypothetical protein